MRGIIALLLIGGLALGPVRAQDYVLQESSVSGGGGTGQTGSGSWTLTSSIGQVVSGTQEGNTVILYSGYPAPLFGTVLSVQVEEELSGDPVSAGEAVPLTAVVTSRRGAVEQVTLYHRPGGETSFEDDEMVEDGEGGRRQFPYAGAIPAEAITERGIAYYVEAVDADGNTARYPSRGVRSFPVRVGDEGIVKDDAQPSGASQSAYRLISVPIFDNVADEEAKSPEDVLEDDLGDYDETAWRFFAPSGEAVSEFSDVNEMTPGRAFWLIVRSERDPIDTGAGEVLAIDRPHEIALQEGWNFIANPFNFPIPLDNVRTANDEEVRLYAYGGDGWSDPSTNPVSVLQPFAGYALSSDDDDALIIDPTGEEASGAADSRTPEKRLAAQQRTAPDWHIRVAGQAGDARDANNVAAVASEAKAGLDAMDAPKPPLVQDELSVAFVRPEWESPHTRFLSDVREEPTRGTTWPFEVETTRREDVVLTFDGLARVPEGFEVWLLDEYSKASQDLRDTPRYTISDPPSGEARSFRLVVGQRSYVEQELQAAGALPTSYELADIYPNPTPGASTIRYGVPKRQDVTITVYNVLGQKVATLMQDRSMEAGFHTVRWDGQGGGGAPVASGVYFVRMRAGDFTASKKIVRVN